MKLVNEMTEEEARARLTDLHTESLGLNQHLIQLRNQRRMSGYVPGMVMRSKLQTAAFFLIQKVEHTTATGILVTLALKNQYFTVCTDWDVYVTDMESFEPSSLEDMAEVVGELVDTLDAVTSAMRAVVNEGQRVG